MSLPVFASCFSCVAWAMKMSGSLPAIASRSQYWRSFSFWPPNFCTVMWYLPANCLLNACTTSYQDWLNTSLGDAAHRWHVSSMTPCVFAVPPDAAATASSATIPVTARTMRLLIQFPSFRDHGLLAHTRNNGFQYFDRFCYRFACLEQLVLVLDADHVVVASSGKRTHNLLPNRPIMAEADCAERPRAVGDMLERLDVEHTLAYDRARPEFGVLRVHVVDRALGGEHRDRLDGVDALPEEMARIKIHADVAAGARAELEQRRRVIDDKARMHLDRDVDSL